MVSFCGESATWVMMHSESRMDVPQNASIPTLHNSQGLRFQIPSSWDISHLWIWNTTCDYKFWHWDGTSSLETGFCTHNLCFRKLINLLEPQFPWPWNKNNVSYLLDNFSIPTLCKSALCSLPGRPTYMDYTSSFQADDSAPSMSI